jgi:glutamate synthase (NADPH) small chain
MGKATGFLEIERHDRNYEKPEARLKNYQEFVKPLGKSEIREYGLRNPLLP